MNFTLNSVLVALALFASMIICGEIGHRIGVRRLDRDPTASRGVVEAAVFALLGLLIAFTFSAAADRFDKRRAQIVDEANAIGTAYLRLSLLPSPARDELKEQFRRYLDTRLAVYRSLPDFEASKANLDSANRMQSEIWNAAVAASEGSQANRLLVLPAINEMIDVTTRRTVAA